MKNLLFISFLIFGVILSFVSCLNTEGGGNYQTFPVAPAVVNNNSARGGTTLLTYWDEIATPELTGHEQGDCLFVQFKLNYDQQPSSNYYTATEVTVIEEVEHGAATYFEDKITPDDFKLPIETMVIADYSNTISLDGKCFFYFKHQVAKDQSIKYRMLASPNDLDETGAYNIYLLAKKDNKTEGTSTSLVKSYYAFDMKEVILNLGRDTTVNNIGLKYMKVNLKFFTKEENDSPVFEKYNSTPIELAVRK
jgi:hypothetical protein